jgi:hypothetical protein
MVSGKCTSVGPFKQEFSFVSFKHLLYQRIQEMNWSTSLSISARVVRDLHNLTGAELIADEAFFKKLQKLNSKEESGRDTSDSPTNGPDTSSTVISSTAPSNLKESANIDATVPNIQASKAKAGKTLPEQEEHSEGDTPWYHRKDSKLQAILQHCGGQGLHALHHDEKPPRRDAQPFHDDEESSSYESSHRSSESDCSECTVYSSCSSEDEADPHKHRMRCTPHNEAHIGRVRGRNRKLLDGARSNVTEEAIEAERMKQDRLSQRHPDAILNESFPGGAKHAHQLAKRWDEEEKLKKERLKRLKELDSIQASMMKKKKKKKDKH